MSDRKLPEILTADEEKALLATFNTRYASPFRNRCMILVALNTGARIGDLVNMKWGDITLDSGKWHIKQGKGRKDRVVFIKPTVLDELLKLAEKTGGDRTGYVFTTRKDNPVPPTYLRDMIRNRAASAGITKRVYFHLLRHTYLSNLYSHTKNIRLVQEVAGHSSIQTTQIYTHISGEDIRAAMLDEPAPSIPKTSPAIQPASKTKRTKKKTEPDCLQDIDALVIKNGRLLMLTVQGVEKDLAKLKAKKASADRIQHEEEDIAKWKARLSEHEAKYGKVTL